MNVIRTEKTAEPSRNRAGRLEGRLRERAAPVAIRNVTVPPKYQFDVALQSRQRYRSSSTRTRGVSDYSTTPITPACYRRRDPASTSSAIRSSSRVGTSGHSGGNTSSTEWKSIILAITAGRGDARTEVGMASIDLRYPHLVLCQISDCQTYVSTLTKIYILEPLEILMPDTMCDSKSAKGKLFQSIKKKFSNLEVTPISRVHFNESIGLERVKTLCAKEYSSVELFVKEKYYALAAAAALLKYVECMQRIAYVPKSLRIEFQGSPYASVIDVESAENLELVSSQSGQRNFSLLGVLDHCSTPMGRRLLRASILQPYYEEQIILIRQSCVAELVSNRSLRALIQPIVSRLNRSDRLLSMSMQPLEERNTIQSAEQTLNFVLLLKNTVDIVPELRSVLSDAQSEFFRKVHESLQNPEFQLIKEKILRVVHPDARSVIGYTSSNMQRCFAIKAGLNDLLDIARQTYCELIDDMKTMVESLASQYSLPLSLACTSSLGYHIQAVFPRNSTVNITDFPEEFIEVKKNKNTFTMTTNTLIVSSQQCKLTSDELHMMSNALLCDLVKRVREHVGCLFELTADVAELDVAISLSQISSLPEYVKPSFSNRLEVESSVHPIMAAFSTDRPVANDIHASVPHNFHIITGPNMSGKSTYLKQIVLLQIMAQIGCYVPATKAEFRIADRIFCRISFHDDMESNASTFTVEIKEAQYIIQSLTARSLIVLDELCRGTTVEEGTSIAYGIYGSLFVTSAFSFAATHFLYLTKLADMYHNVTNHYFETVKVTPPGSTEPRLTYTHQLKVGRIFTDEYGISLAELSGIAASITQQARKLASAEIQQGMTNDETEVDQDSKWNKKCYDLIAQIYLLIESGRLNQETLHELLRKSDLNVPNICENTSTQPLQHLPSNRSGTVDINFEKNASQARATNNEKSVFEERSSIHTKNSFVLPKHSLSMGSHHSQKIRILGSKNNSIVTPPSLNSLTEPSSELATTRDIMDIENSDPDPLNISLPRSVSISQEFGLDTTLQLSNQSLLLSDSNERFLFNESNQNLDPERRSLGAGSMKSLQTIGSNSPFRYTPIFTSTPEAFDYYPPESYFMPSSHQDLSNTSLNSRTNSFFKD